MRSFVAVAGSAIVSVLIVASAATAQSPLVARFTAGTEAWLIRDLNCTNYSGSANFPVEWVPTGGVPGGYISAEDPSAQCFFFEAPSAWGGNRSAFIGRVLRFHVRTDLNNYPQGAVVLLVSPSLTLVHTFAVPDATWAERAVPLTNTAFRVGSANGSVSTPAQFAAVMGNLQFLRISGEFGAVVAERSDLDCVRFGDQACPADLDGSGTVDGADLGTLLSLWGTTSGLADLNCDGIVDGADLGVFLSAWGDCL